MRNSIDVDNEFLEVKLLLEAIYQKYGYDFREYSSAHTKRRLKHRLVLSGLDNFSQMQHKLIYDENFFNQILLDLSINVTEMFRDPFFYKKLREQIIPDLKTYPFVNLWHAGCSSGQEVYSMSIVLEEEGLKDRTQIYATDFNETILKKAQQGCYPIDLIKNYTLNYQKAGGKRSFSDYYNANSNNAILERSLKDKVLFSSHNLVTDRVFGQMQIIICRNVLIYFNKELQNKVVSLFYESLCKGGFLCLGSKESLKFTDFDFDFEIVAKHEKIFRKRH